MQNYDENKKLNAKVALGDFFQKVCELDKKKEIGGDALYEINHVLAQMITQMNNGEEVTKRDIKAKPEGARGVYGSVLPIIIYSNPNYEKTPTNIGEETFVNQFMHPNGYRWIYQLEPNYENLKKFYTGKKSSFQTKKLAHGAIHSTQFFYSHDYIAHSLNASNITEEPIWGEFFIRLDKIRRELKNKNDYLILTKAIFYLFHENKGFYGDYFSAGIKSPKIQLMLATKKYRDYSNNGYKEADRDNENMLVTRDPNTKHKISLRDKNNLPFLRDEKGNDLLIRDENGKTAFSKLSPMDKNEAVKGAYERFWDRVKEILDENEFNWEMPKTNEGTNDNYDFN